MNNRFTKIKEWILKTGYPLELEVVDILKNNNWNVRASVNYFDEDEAKWRELDAKASKATDFGEVACAPNWSYKLVFTLVIQCKRSDKLAWVFFPADKGRELGVNYIDFLKVARVQSLAAGDPDSIRHHRVLGVSRDILLEPPLSNRRVAKNIKWLNEFVSFGSMDFQSFADVKIASIGATAPLSGKGDAPKQLFGEAATVTKALAYELDLTSNVHHATLSLFQVRNKIQLNSKPHFDIEMVLPMLIFDGAMCLWKGKEKDLEEIDHVVYAFDNRSPFYFGQYTINIVRKDFFITFLRKLDKDLKSLSLKFREKKSEFDEQVKLFVST